MNNNDLGRLANQFVSKTLQIDPDSRVWIDYQGEASKPLADACIMACRNIGVEPFVIDFGKASLRAILDNATRSGNLENSLRLKGKELLAQMQQITHYLKIDEIANTTRARLTEKEDASILNLITGDLNEYRRLHTRWLIVDAPTKEFAQSCGMSQREADDFYLGACLADYIAMADKIEPLKELMSGNKHFKVTGHRTKLTGQFANVTAVPCVGDRNLPDGECFTAPLSGSINGHILFEKTQYNGVAFPWVYLEVEDGYIRKATSATDELTIALNAILNTDEGARQFGEWAVGFNPMITKIIGNVLFDEKVSGTMHMAVGRCIAQTPNGVSSKIHWDLVKDQRQRAGGGDIVIDDELIRRNGLFVTPNLTPLNPQNLILR